MPSFPYLPNSETDRKKMLSRIGVNSVEELIDKAVPKELQYKGSLPIPPSMDEVFVQRLLTEIAEKNDGAKLKCFAGGGAYAMFVPAAVDEISARPEFYTAYTPYQPEVSQGTLTAIFEFQSMITALTGMDVANASMYDGASATAEAIIMALHHNEGRKDILFSQAVNPLYLEVIKTYLSGFDVNFIQIPIRDGRTDIFYLDKLLSTHSSPVCLLVQNPNFYGVIENMENFAERIHKAGGLFVVAVVDPTSLGILEPPGKYGADIVSGEAQQFGNYLNFGGPYLGFLASKSEFIRKMPGRIVGMTSDVEGHRGFVMVFQTREQHIKRAKATSNICTNQQWCALRATIYLSLLGEEGFRKNSMLLFNRAHYFANELGKIPNVSIMFKSPFYREFAVKLPKKASDVIEIMAQRGILAGVDLGRFVPAMEDVMLVSASDIYGKSDIDEYTQILKDIL